MSTKRELELNKLFDKFEKTVQTIPDINSDQKDCESGYISGLKSGMLDNISIKGYQNSVNDFYFNRIFEVINTFREKCIKRYVEQTDKKDASKYTLVEYPKNNFTYGLFYENAQLGIVEVVINYAKIDCHFHEHLTPEGLNMLYE